MQGTCLRLMGALVGSGSLKCPDLPFIVLCRHGDAWQDLFLPGAGGTRGEGFRAPAGHAIGTFFGLLRFMRAGSQRDDPAKPRNAWQKVPR